MIISPPPPAKTLERELPLDTEGVGRGKPQSDKLKGNIREYLEREDTPTRRKKLTESLRIRGYDTDISWMDTPSIRIKPNNADTYNYSGINYKDLGMYKEAIEAFKQAIRFEPNHTYAHYGLGVAYRKSGKNKEAIEAFKQAIRIKPNHAYAHKSLGVIYHDLGMYKEAIEAYKQALRIKPNHASAHYGLGVTYLKLNDSDSALEQYKILKALDRGLASKLFNNIYY